MHFEFATAAKIIFGPGTAASIPNMAANFGSTVCLVTGSSPKRTQWVVDALAEKQLSTHVVSISGEPSTTIIADAANAARNAGCDVVIAIGGGSVLDAGKALAALLTNTADLFDYLEVIGKGQPLTEKPAPLIAVPTTSGTGSEVTANAVLLSPEHGVKVSMRSADMIPNVALIDPELTLSMPPEVTASTGMDALCQLIEAYVSNKSNPMTDCICREGLYRCSWALKTAYDDGSEITARGAMAMAGMFSGIALANAKLGAVHGFAAPLGGEFNAPHGVVCASLLPHVMAMNIRALKEREPDSPALDAYTEVAAILTGEYGIGAEDGITWVQELCEDLNIPGLKEMGVKTEDFAALADKAAKASSMKGNPLKLTKAELVEILERAY
ncbi:MAG: iron-containing alcohol dehydrogenase [Pseudodesulfovibrio sp.]